MTGSDRTDEREAVAARLEELRAELRAERISYGELAELQGLAEHIEPGDVELLEAAGVPEFEEERSGIRRAVIESIEVRRVVDEDPDTSYLEQEDWADRLEEYRNGGFYFEGVVAVATLKVPTSQGGWIHTGEISSPGLWGIESDSGESYFEEIGKEQVDELREILRDGYGFSDEEITGAAV
jgi:hypothetical protein